MQQQETIFWQGKPFHYYCKLVFTKYTVSDKRIIIDAGLLRVNTEETRLHRVTDISVTATLFQRMFGRGTLVVYTMDVTAPTIVLRDIPNYKRLAGQISDAVERERSSHRYNEVTTNFRDGQQYQGQQQY